MSNRAYRNSARGAKGDGDAPVIVCITAKKHLVRRARVVRFIIGNHCSATDLASQWRFRMMRMHVLVFSVLCVCLAGCAGRGRHNMERGLAHGEYTVELNGMRLWYKVSGTGPVCLMPTPAWGPSSDLYFRTLGAMEKLFTVVYVDSRGTGRSGRAKSLQEYTWNHLIGDLDALRAHLGQKSVWLMGHSEGGVQVLQYAIEHPERVRGLVLLSSQGVQDSDWLEDLKRRQTRRQGEPWYEEAARAFESETAPTTDEEFARTLQASLPLYWSDPAKIGAFENDFSAALPSAHAAAAANESNRYPFDLRPGLKRIKSPTLIVVGADDIVCSPESAMTLHLALQNSKLLMIEQCGHFPWMEQPEAFEAKVPEFLRELGLAAVKGTAARQEQATDGAHVER